MENEIVDRIPWETLEARGNDRNWLVYTLSAALVVGALSYSFFSSRSTVPVAAETSVTAAAELVSVTTVAPESVATTTPALVVAEADLFALDPGSLDLAARAHAEWVAVEYVSFDGSQETLRQLLPADVELPATDEGSQVYIDFATDMTSVRIDSTNYEVGVLVRSLVSGADAPFVRQEPLLVTVPVRVGGDGTVVATGRPDTSVYKPVAPAAIGVDLPGVNP